MPLFDNLVGAAEQREPEGDPNGLAVVASCTAGRWNFGP
jgi:hypothetical protein